MMDSTMVLEMKTKKCIAREVFEDATFTLHKWHSNAMEVEANELPSVEWRQLEQYSNDTFMYLGSIRYKPVYFNLIEHLIFIHSSFVYTYFHAF